MAVIDVPLSLEEAHALEGPGVVVGQETVVKPPSSMGACGHTPLCAIVLPLMLVERMFPDKHVELMVLEDGVETWRGAYTTGGELLHGRKRDGETFRDVRVMELPQLGRDLVLEVSSAPVSDPEAVTPTLIQTQIDLLQLYRDALLEEEDPLERGELLVEAWTWMGEEAWPLLEVYVPEEPDESQAAVVLAACRAEQLDAVRGLIEQPGPWTASRLWGCGEQTDENLRTLVAGACEDTELVREVANTVGSREELPELVARCPELYGRVDLQLRLGHERSLEDTELLLMELGRVPSAVVQDLDPETERQLFLGPALLGPNQDALLGRALGLELSPTVEEAGRLLVLFEEDEGLDIDRPGRKARVLELLRGGDEAVHALAIERLQTRAVSDEASHAHAGLVVLGLVEHQLPAARGLPLVAMPVSRSEDVVSPESLPAWALFEAGCTDEISLRAAKKKAKAASDGARGRVCPG